MGTNRSPEEGKGTEMVRVPSLDKLETTDSGFTPLGNEKLWEKFLEL